MKGRWLRGTPIAVSAVLAVLTSAAGAATTSIWTVVPTPNPGGQTVSDIYFLGVSAASATDAWSVGIDQIGAFRVPLVEHWNGKGWQAMSPPRPSQRQSWFNGVLDLSRTNAWAVGESTDPRADNTDERTLIEHWDGTSWSIVPSPNPAVTGNSGDVLNAIAAAGPGDLWAVGWEHNVDENILLFEHFDGTSWSAVQPPSGGTEQFGTGIAAVAPNDVWAVGTNAVATTLAAHWNGRRWSLVSTPSLHDGINPLNSLTGVTVVASDDVWASGYEGNVNNQNFMTPYMLHWNGTNWSMELIPNRGGEGSRPNGTTALSATDVWAVGQTQELNGSILTYTEQYDGTTWKAVPSPNPGTNGQLVVNSLDAVAGVVPGHLVAVGSQEISGQCCLRTLAMVTASG